MSLNNNSQFVQHYPNNTLQFALQLVEYVLNNILQAVKYDVGITFPY